MNAVAHVIEAVQFGVSEPGADVLGAAQPQLVFAGFGALDPDDDPLWIPFTEDEIEDLGELADRDATSKDVMS